MSLIIIKSMLVESRHEKHMTWKSNDANLAKCPTSKSHFHDHKSLEIMKC